MRIRPCMTRLSPNFVKKFVPFRKSDDKGCLQALQPDARYRNRRDRHMTGGPGFGSEHFKQYDFLHDKEERPFLSGQEFDPETIQKMAEGSMG